MWFAAVATVELLLGSLVDVSLVLGMWWTSLLLSCTIAGSAFIASDPAASNSENMTEPLLVDSPVFRHGLFSCRARKRRLCSLVWASCVSLSTSLMVWKHCVQAIMECCRWGRCHKQSPQNLLMHIMHPWITWSGLAVSGMYWPHCWQNCKLANASLLCAGYG